MLFCSENVVQIIRCRGDRLAWSNARSAQPDRLNRRPKLCAMDAADAVAEGERLKQHRNALCSRYRQMNQRHRRPWRTSKRLLIESARVTR